jgi:hypothetical protein
MKYFWVEGLISAKDGSSRKGSSAVKPFSQSYWANTAQEALQLALQDHPRVRWIEGPSISETSEEQRMRAMGAPELFSLEPKQPRKKK